MKILLYLLLLVATRASAQELFAFTEPASNMPAHSIGVRLTNNFFTNNNRLSYRLLPEVMFGISKRLMVHADAFLSNTRGQSRADGAGLYAKYRFFSNDDVHRHFRMAAFARLSYNNSPIQQEDIMLSTQNSGYGLGVITTQLVHKYAFSSTLGFERATQNDNYHFLPGTSSSAITYSVSAGKLVLPKSYTSYRQTNVNAMLELLGQTLPQSGKSYLDIAPVVQFIINSQARIDLGYRQQLFSTMQRMNEGSIMLRVEYLFFNALRKK